MTGIKRTPADIAFSQCIRERSGWTCERCGISYPDNSAGLQCAHIFGRANKAVRLEPLNAVSLCGGCHMYFTANPMNFAIFVKDKLGDSYGVLNELSNDIMRGKEYVRAIKSGDAAKHYRKELSRMQAVRSCGDTGRIEFVGYI